MLKIRLNRIGKKKKAFYKVVVSEHSRTPRAKYLELLGSYDPHESKIEVDSERVKYWIGKGATPSPTVNNLLINNGIIEGEKMQSWKPKRKKKGEVTGQENSAEVKQAGEAKTEGTPTEQPAETEQESPEVAEGKPEETKE